VCCKLKVGGVVESAALHVIKPRLHDSRT